MAQKLDVCIRGDGIVGRSLALLLARQKLRVGLITSAPKSKPDVRAYSLNSASRALLTELGCWPGDTHATPVQHMRVWGDAGGLTQFESPTPEGLTSIVDVPVLEAQLAQAVAQQAHIRSLSAPEAAALTVVCEGRASATRDELGVAFHPRPYAQHALAARVQCSTPHGQQALQWFSQGPQGLEILALLPLGGALGESASLVWSLPPARAQALLAMQAPAFAKALTEASHGRLGDLTLNSERALWPLQRACAQRWTGQFADASAWALAGDAAHTIHPLAGLGLNLGLADVAELSRIFQNREAKDHWRGVGDRYFLRRYERTRKAAMQPTWLACDGLQGLFAHPSASAQALRNAGMKGFDQLAPVKAWVMHQAMG